MVQLFNFLNTDLFFYLFLFILGLLFLVTALLMIFAQSSVHSILYLMFLFLYLTELTILLRMEFLALMFLIIYIGAVCVLMLFHIKLIKTFVHRYDNIHSNELFVPFLAVVIFLPLILICTVTEASLEGDFNKRIEYLNLLTVNIKFYGVFPEKITYYNYTHWVDLYETFKSTEILGFLLYNIYFIHLLFGSLVLLIAMVGSIFLTLIRKKDKKFQTVSTQVFVDITNSLIIRE